MLTPTRPSPSRITGTGRCCPEKILTNPDLEKMVDTTDEWITTRTGIRERRIARGDVACSDLATAAAERALEMAGVDPADLDGVFVGTVTGDTQFPATAVYVQERIGARKAAAMDVSAACSGFIYGVNLAHGMIASGQMDRVLVIGAEVLSKFVDWRDRATCVLFGDGAGAAVLEPCPAGEGILAARMQSDGALADLLIIPAGGSRKPLTDRTFADRDRYIKMKGDGVFKHAVRAMADATRAAVEDAGRRLDDVDLLVPHQANIRIIDAMNERLGIDRERIVVNVDRYGNTSSASIPIAYDEAVRGGRVKPGDLVVFTGFGGGFTWGAVALENFVTGKGGA
jgi:3-oxoacyl-[acyl-carrier-protein] synthase-3